MSLAAHDLGVTIDRDPVLSGISLEVRSGEVLGLIGPNGAGKSTLLRALAGLVRADRGEVLAGGERVASLSARERAARTAFVAQDTGVAADITAMELVLMGRYAHRRRFSGLAEADARIAREALESVGMLALADRAVPSLSGGERQLVQIARALAQRADALLLDEPTSALDVHHQLRVFSILRERAAAGSAIAVVLHDLNDASRYCDRLAVVHDGSLFAGGAPHEVLVPETLAAVYRIEARVHDDERGYPHVHPLGYHDERTPLVGRPS